MGCRGFLVEREAPLRRAARVPVRRTEGSIPQTSAPPSDDDSLCGKESPKALRGARSRLEEQKQDP